MRRRPNEQRTFGFTIIEVLVVMTIILVLAGLVLGTSSYVHNKAARSRAQAEIAAMSAALENYKADNGVYPSMTVTDSLDSKLSDDPANYRSASTVLYETLTGDAGGQGGAPISKSYISFKTNRLSTTTPFFVQDPFGNSYGYSTAGQAAATSVQSQTTGYNPTFDLWSTANSTTGQVGWIKNW